MVEVNRPDRRTRAVRGKSDPIDAENAARRAPAGQDTATPKDTTTVVESVRALTVARSGAVKARTAALNQIRDLLTTAPEPLRTTFRGQPLKQVAAAGARLRPDPARLPDPLMATKTALRSIGRRVQLLTEEIAELDRQLAGLLDHAAPPHHSPVRDLHPARRATAHHRRRQPRTPGDGGVIRRPLRGQPHPRKQRQDPPPPAHRAGDRDANRTLHMVAVLRMRWHEPTRAYVRRRSEEGLSKREIMR